MATTRYCYTCFKYHPEEEMRLVATKGGKRWRCLKSMELIKKTTGERDTFGKEVTATNSAKLSARLKASKKAKSSA